MLICAWLVRAMLIYAGRTYAGLIHARPVRATPPPGSCGARLWASARSHPAIAVRTARARVRMPPAAEHSLFPPKPS